MAVIEIAKIQVRRGQAEQSGMPQLDSGEFGWAIDQQKLYVGNGSLSEGAPYVGNTEVITEHTLPNIFNLPNYTYEGNIGTTVITGLNNSGDTVRTIQQKLDDIINIQDFGVTPSSDGSTYVTQQVQQAIDQVFLNSNGGDIRARRKLYFPAGYYKVTSTIYIPSHANIIGDGPDKTVFIIASTSTTLMQTVGTTSTVGSYQMFAEGDTNIGSNQEPGHISLDGISLAFDGTIGRTNVSPLLRLDCLQDSQITNCMFVGNHDISSSSGDGYTGIELRGQEEITSSKVVIRDCYFDQLKIGIKSKFDIKDITITENKFYNLFRGIEFGTDVAVGKQAGPSFVNISNNTFDTVEYEGIYVGTSSIYTNIVSSQNTFREVGNNVQGINFAQSPAIAFYAPGNNTYGDRFERDYRTGVGINLTGTYVTNVVGKTTIQSGVVYTATIQSPTANPVDIAIIPFPGTSETIRLDYIINKYASSWSRQGKLLIGIHSLTNNTTATVTDNYVNVDNAATPIQVGGGIEFNATLDPAKNFVRIQYISTTTTVNNAPLEYTYTILQ